MCLQAMKMAGHGYNLRSGRRRSSPHQQTFILPTKVKPVPPKINVPPPVVLDYQQLIPHPADQCPETNHNDHELLLHHSNPVFPFLIALLLYHRPILDLWFSTRN
ncbi:uncharacterized protein LOC131877186 [Tigriopus californicus]|uniref:uncharacterized protein LOC131877186 n=1 Tax=Tigriopus californicus TaxID=6832 RepID=UPI0027DA4BCB|nr:uncharacterized protein LOC131877186 [Tigriopus californicus]